MVEHTSEKMRAHARKHAPDLASSMIDLCGDVITKGVAGILEKLLRLHQEKRELLDALKMAHQSLRYAASDVADWGGYAGEYMQKKHGLSDDIQAYTNAAESACAAIAKAEGGAA